MSAMSPSDLPVSFSETEWRRFVTPGRRRPSLLVSCANSGVGPVIARLVTVCVSPVHVCHLPGPLDLPDDLTGTLLLSDVAQLTPDQQIALHDWMERCGQEAQVISVTSGRLPALVECGQFHEGLFYRLNVVSLLATVGDGRPAIRADRRSQTLPPPGLDCSAGRAQAVASL